MSWAIGRLLIQSKAPPKTLLKRPCAGHVQLAGQPSPSECVDEETLQSFEYRQGEIDDKICTKSFIWCVLKKLNNSKSICFSFLLDLFQMLFG